MEMSDHLECKNLPLTVKPNFGFDQPTPPDPPPPLRQITYAKRNPCPTEIRKSKRDVRRVDILSALADYRVGGGGGGVEGDGDGESKRMGR